MNNPIISIIHQHFCIPSVSPMLRPAGDVLHRSNPVDPILRKIPQDGKQIHIYPLVMTNTAIEHDHL